MENTRPCCFEKAPSDASIMFSLSFLNTVLFGVAAVASQPALVCAVSLLSLQELLVYQLSSNSFAAVFFFSGLSSRPPSSITHFILAETVFASRYELKDLLEPFLFLMTSLINFTFYSPASLLHHRVELVGLHSWNLTHPS